LLPSAAWERMGTVHDFRLRCPFVGAQSLSKGMHDVPQLRLRTVSK
jgi:hypothetical protein